MGSVVLNLAYSGTGTTPGTPTPPGGPTTPPTAVTNSADNFLAYAFGRTVIDGSGHPYSPRKVAFTLRQDISAGTNPYLNSIEIWYKPSQNPKWFRTIQNLSNAQGTDITFTLELGSASYPLRPGVELPGAVDNYDFIFKFAYSDGKTSSWQYRAMGCSVEYGNYGWDVYVLDPGSSFGTIYKKELASAYIPLLAGPSDIPETRNMTVAIKAISNSLSTNKIIFGLEPPLVADQINWAGMRIYRK
jgi:hypothetical protein